MLNKLQIKDVVHYWKTICETRKDNESLAYPKINKLMSYLFTFPHSSASVWREFLVQLLLTKLKLETKLETRK